MFHFCYIPSEMDSRRFACTYSRLTCLMWRSFLGRPVRQSCTVDFLHIDNNTATADCLHIGHNTATVECRQCCFGNVKTQTETDDQEHTITNTPPGGADAAVHVEAMAPLDRPVHNVGRACFCKTGRAISGVSGSLTGS